MPSPPTSVVRVRVPAKINLWLSVGPPRADGFHDLQTVFHAVDLVDDVVASAASRMSLTVTGIADGVPDGPENIAWRAVDVLAAEVGVEPAVRLRIHKRIPVAGGMAGGSADAAGTLLAVNALWGDPVGPQRLAHLAAELGSDVAFPLAGGTAIGVGRGEVLTPISSPPLHWVLVPASIGIAAGSAYRELDRERAESTAPPPIGEAAPLLTALATGDIADIAGTLRNDLQAAALQLRPELAATLDAGRTAGALAGIVSGSGPTCAFLCRSAPDAAAVAERLGASAVVAAGPVEPTVCVP